MESRVSMPDIKNEYKHITQDDRGRAVIEGTNMRVCELIDEHHAHGWSADELHWQHPYLTLAQIHAAFTYYYDHQEQIDEESRAALARAEDMSTQAEPTSVFRKKLKEMGRL